MEQCDGLINFRSGNQGRKRKKKNNRAGGGRTGAKKEEAGQVIYVCFAGKAKDGCGSHSQGPVEMRQMFRSAISLCPHLGNS